MEIGDPTVLGWTTFAAYGFAALLCARAAATLARLNPASREAVWWWRGFALLLLALGLNKQLDLQTTATHVLREWSREQGWYPYRRAVQKVAFAVIGGGGLLVSGTLAVKGRRFLTEQPLIPIGWGLVAAYVILRLASFEHIGSLAAGRLSEGENLFPLELGGLLCLIIAAQRARRPRPEPPGPEPPMSA